MHIKIVSFALFSFFEQANTSEVRIEIEYIKRFAW